ncbi:MFS transporter [Thioalkalivibrio sp. ALMg11]|uniref:MFS transporter n=1 Tax=Thioalkalivibrio sp. ALMg11 TaxID=1158165 RepID=UPI00037616C2|nr:MFS transporter [Thioalkalivibrio sp. ALMg11]
MTETSDIRRKGFVAHMATVFINALNDNFFRLVVIFIAIREFVAEGEGTFYYSLVGFVFLLPFVLFSPWAGYIADRYSKKIVIVCTRMAEAAVLLTAALMLITDNFPGLLVTTFLMGLQSTFFSPAKFGILPELVRYQQLSRANGHIQLWTFLAIILGTALAGFVMEFAGEALWVPAALIVTLSVTGLVTSLFIAPTLATDNPAPFRLNPFATVMQSVTEIRPQRVLFMVILGIAWFWALGTLYQLNVPLFAEVHLELGELATGIILTALALGIGTGSILAGYLSRGGIAMHHAPAGMIAAALISALLYFATDSYPATLMLMALLGIASGFFIVPITAYLQGHSPADRRGRFIAASNFLAFSAMLVAPVLFWLLTGPAGATPAHVFMIGGLASLLVGLTALRLYRRHRAEADA